MPRQTGSSNSDSTVQIAKSDTGPISHQNFLSVRVGAASGRSVQFTLGEASGTYNAMVSGCAGSGKTTFIQNLILSICEQYSPDQIRLVLLDEGLSFFSYRAVAHVQAVLDHSQDGDGLARLFQWLQHEVGRRMDVFRRCGAEHEQTVGNLQNYTRLTGDSLPRLLLVIDEFGGLMRNQNTVSTEVDDHAIRVSRMAEETINLIAREGRKVGMHIVVVTQSFANVDCMPRDIKSYPHVAFGLKASTPQDSRALFNSENDAAYRIELYQAVCNAQDGKVEGNIIFDLDYVPDDTLTNRQDSLRGRWPVDCRSELDCIVTGDIHG